MDNMFSFSSNYNGVLPSGVSFTIRELLTGDQSELQKKVKAGNKKAFIEMLASAFISIGDNTKVDVKAIEKMLSNDINYAFVKLREITFKDRGGDEEDEDADLFVFKNEFPLESGETEKHIETFKVRFNKEFFKTVPYEWVQDKITEIAEDFKVKNPKKDYEPDYLSSGDFPQMYGNYDKMLEAQKKRVFELNGIEISWEVIDGRADEYRRRELSFMDDITASLYMRKPTMMVEKTDDNTQMAMRIEWEKIPAYYSDKFRKEFMRVEGSVDTIITVRSELKPNKVERINLISTVAFFLPSLGT